MGALLATSLGIAIFEGLGIAVFFPVLQTSGVANSIQLPFPFSKVSVFFLSMPIEQKLKSVAILLILVTLIRLAFIYVNINLSLLIRTKVIKFLKIECMRQLMVSGMSYFNKKRSSDLQMIFEHHIELGIGMIIEMSCDILPSVFTVILLIIFLFMFSWPITLVSLGLFVVASLFLNCFAKRIQKSGEQYNFARAGFNKVLFDIIQGMKVLRLFNREKYMTSLFEEKVDAFLRGHLRLALFSKSIGPIFEMVGSIILASILFLGAYLIPKTSGALLPILITFLIIIARLIPSLKQFNQARGAIIARLPSIREVKNFLRPNDKEYLYSGTIIFRGLKERIEFQNVEFGYNPQEAVVLHHMAFSVLQGTKLGIVGVSGSGKSTIAELLLRFYDPQQGQVLIDGIDLREFDLNSWRRSIGVVSQDTFLFHDTIRANIAFAKPDATLEEIERSAYRAHAHEFIKNLPLGYDTVVGDRGVLLSGGQRQRLAIARAVLTEPEILIFDEATSALDSQSEQLVQQALDEISTGKTVLTIAHRLSTVLGSDKIMVIEKGKVIEFGEHEELLRKKGFYSQLAMIQNLEV